MIQTVPMTWTCERCGTKATNDVQVVDGRINLHTPLHWFALAEWADESIESAVTRAWCPRYDCHAAYAEHRVALDAQAPRTQP